MDKRYELHLSLTEPQKKKKEKETYPRAIATGAFKRIPPCKGYKHRLISALSYSGMCFTSALLLVFRVELVVK